LSKEPGAVQRQLRVNTIAEVVLGFSATALVSAFGTFAPE
jgi:hypothetical protein